MDSNWYTVSSLGLTDGDLWGFGISVMEIPRLSFISFPSLCGVYRNSQVDRSLEPALLTQAARRTKTYDGQQNNILFPFLSFSFNDQEGDMRRQGEGQRSNGPLSRSGYKWTWTSTCPAHHSFPLRAHLFYSEMSVPCKPFCAHAQKHCPMLSMYLGDGKEVAGRV